MGVYEYEFNGVIELIQHLQHWKTLFRPVTRKDVEAYFKEKVKTITENHKTKHLFFLYKEYGSDETNVAKDGSIDLIGATVLLLETDLTCENLCCGFK